MARHTVIFDTDPGIDDAMALLFLHLSPAVELAGITTVLGNATVETTTRNALFLKERFGLSAPVAKGAGAPLVGRAGDPPTFVHGHNGLGDIPLPETIGALADPRPAHRFIIDTVRAQPGAIDIVAVGRLTNLALALREDPEVVTLVRSVVIMGGAFGYHGHLGNITPAAEANIHGDPLAADEVFAAAWPIIAVGLDVTQETIMSTEYLRSLGEEAGEIGRFIWDISRHYEDFYRSTGLEGICVHDASAAACLLAPELFEMRAGAIRVVQEGIALGQTIQKPDWRRFRPNIWDGRPSHQICTHVNSPALLALYRDTILGHAN